MNLMVVKIAHKSLHNIGFVLSVMLMNIHVYLNVKYTAGVS